LQFKLFISWSNLDKYQRNKLAQVVIIISKTITDLPLPVYLNNVPLPGLVVLQARSQFLYSRIKYQCTSKLLYRYDSS
jgi:hypothetical protein